ncbi:Uncharacterised protein [Vibrio cholerae]|nr:Uncharacterised protein [Vibrio cholerae]
MDIAFFTSIVATSKQSEREDLLSRNFQLGSNGIKQRAFLMVERQLKFS